MSWFVAQYERNNNNQSIKKRYVKNTVTKVWKMRIPTYNIIQFIKATMYIVELGSQRSTDSNNVLMNQNRGKRMKEILLRTLCVSYFGRTQVY